MAERRRPRPPLFALLLVAAGVVLLLQNLDLIGWGFWLEIWRFWPVLLMAVGVNIMLGRRLPWLATAIVVALVCGSAVWAALLAESGRDTVVARTSKVLGETNRLDMAVDIGFGSLTIDSLPSDSPNLVEWSLEAPCGGAATSFNRHGDAATLDVTMDPGSFACQWGADWRVSLSRVPDVYIDIDTGASSIELDLTDLRVPVLNVNAGAASVFIKMPADAGPAEAVISAGASSIDVRIPDGVPARILNDSALSSLNVSSRFQSLRGAFSEGQTVMRRDPGEIFQSPGYREAENRVSIELNVGVSSVSVY